MNAFDLVFDGAVVVCGRILSKRHADAEIDYALLERSIKPVAHKAIDTLLAEWSDLVEANVSEATTRAFLNAQANELGWKFADAYSDELAWAA